MDIVTQQERWDALQEEWKLDVKCECEGCEYGFIPTGESEDDFILVECLNPIHN